MLVKRTVVALVLLPIGLAAIFLGGWVYAAVIALIAGLAAWEYARLFKQGGFQPGEVLVVGGAVLLAAGRAWNGFDSASWLLSALILAAMAYHLLAYERGRDQAGSDFAISLSGILYLGWIGAYLISLRQLPEGEWWLLVILPAVWLADMGAYFAGSRFGKHKLSPRLSPKKTWEGYLAGIPLPLLQCAAGSPFQTWTGPGPAITPLRARLDGVPHTATGESTSARRGGDSGNEHLGTAACSPHRPWLWW
jgi:phosphatidate cytidylyltransferase